MNGGNEWVESVESRNNSNILENQHPPIKPLEVTFGTAQRDVGSFL